VKAPRPDPDGLLCALVLAPRAFARNRFYALYEDRDLARVRRRATRVRGVVRQLVGHGRERATVTGEHVLGDGRVLLRFQVPSLAFQRTIALAPIEAAAMRFALHRAGVGPLAAEDRASVERALARLGPELEPDLAADGT
jgi:hypothetical protein